MEMSVLFVTWYSGSDLFFFVPIFLFFVIVIFSIFLSFFVICDEFCSFLCNWYLCSFVTIFHDWYSCGWSILFFLWTRTLGKFTEKWKQYFAHIPSLIFLAEENLFSVFQIFTRVIHYLVKLNKTGREMWKIN